MPESVTNVDVSIRIERIYVCSASLNVIDPPVAFELKWRPNMQVHIETRNRSLGGERHEVVIKLELSADINGKKVLEVKVEQGALVHIGETIDEARDRVLNVVCPNLMFPYLREVVDNLAVKATLPAIGLAPIDFGNLQQTANVKQKSFTTMQGFKNAKDDEVLN